MQSLPNSYLTLLDNGVYVMTTLTGGRETVKEYFQHLDYMQSHIGEDLTVRYVVDLRKSGFPSLNAMYNEASAWFKRNPNYYPSRTVFLIDNPVVTSMASTLASLLSRDSNSKWKWRFISTSQYDEGINWLLSDK